MAKEKSSLHPRNPHRFHYDFPALVQVCPELGPYVHEGAGGRPTIDFSLPVAVKLLNGAILRQQYGLEYWDIPPGYLCPPIPGRADYLHYAADLLASSNNGEIPAGKKVSVLDIGAGANCVYPVIGNRTWGWSFTGSEIDPVSLASAREIVCRNSVLAGSISIREQKFPDLILKGIIGSGEFFDLVICNPPFHESAEAANAGTLRKTRNLGTGSVTDRNFGGAGNELWCPGGEVAFLKKMIAESVTFARSCLWFTGLVSRKESLVPLYKALRNTSATEVRTVVMSQGQKTSRFLAWSFLDEGEREHWATERWNKD